MKNMMRILSLAMVLLLLFGAVACGKKEDKGEIKLGQYKGLTVEPYDLEVTDEDVAVAVEAFLSENAVATPVTDRVAQKGDEVVIDYEGSVDGVSSEGMVATDSKIESLGAGGFIEGFEEGIIGRKVGEEFELNLTFPDPYHSEELAGKPVVFKMKLKSITEWVNPEYTDELVEKVAGYKTIAEHKTALTEELKAEKAAKALPERQSILWSKLLASTEVISYPQSIVDEYVTTMEETYQSYAAMYGVEYEEFMKTYLGYESLEQVNADYKVEAESYAKQRMIMDEIIRLENISFTEEEYRAFCQEQVDNSDGQFADIAAFEEQYSREYLEESVYLTKIMDIMLETAVENSAQ